MKNCSLWEGLTLSPCGRDSTLEQRKKVRSPLPEEEGEAKIKCDELTQLPFPIPCAD